MAINWNDDQKKAIETRGKNILVSAAAGSGKTTVLVERIRRLIIDEKVPVDRFLIVTFTNVAASEMKEKIVKALNEAAMEEGADREYLRRQLELVPSANISTFNSFALEVLRRYFYLIDIEPGFKVCDEIQSVLMKNEAMEDVFAESFENGSREFLDFVSRYGSDRNEDKAKSMVLELYTMIMSLPDPHGWLEEKTEALNITKEEFMSGEFVEYIVDDCRMTFETIVSRLDRIIDMLSDNQCTLLAEKLVPEFERLSAIDFSSYDYDDFEKEVALFKLPALRAGKDEKEYYDEIKDTVKKIKDKTVAMNTGLKKKYFEGSIDEQIIDMQDTYPAALELKRLVLAFEKRYRELKEAKGLLDFSDHEHLALQILDNEEAAAEYRDKFEYIFIDEYQDSNDVQEALIDRIKRDDNLFMVGDVKQSIYKFRLAEPEIFMSKYHEYAQDTERNLRIDLNSNFRSKGKIILAVNDVFLDRMEGYGEEARLKKGVSYEGELDRKPELIIIDNEITEDMDVGEDIELMKTAEIEARVSADLIKDVLGRKIHIDKDNTEREITYRDIVVLMRGVKHVSPVYASVFESLGIPCYVDDTEGYFDVMEVSMVISMLSLIDNSRQDVPLLSVLYSPVFRFTTEELSRIRIFRKKVPYYDAFEGYASGGTDDMLREKCRGFLEKLSMWRSMANALELTELVWRLMWDTGYYSYVGALPSGQRRQANLRALVDKTRAAEDMGIYDLYGFLQYVEQSKSGKINIGQMKTISEADDVVRIMTVHKSKGLEFPVVIASSLGKQFKLGGKSSTIKMHKRAGYAISNINNDEHWRRHTLMQNVIDRKIRLEGIEEEKRILYVNFTRARDILYMVGTASGYANAPDKYMYADPDKLNSPLDLILGGLEENDSLDVRVVDMSEIASRIYQRSDAKERLRDMLKEKISYGDEMNRMLSYEYPHEAETRMKYKYSVSELNESAQVYERKAYERRKKEGFTAAEIGTITHKVMENLRFDGSSPEELVEELVRKNILTEEEGRAANLKGVQSFLDSEIGKRAAEAEFIRREQPFTYLLDKEGTEVMVQGIIDCYFEEDGELVLLDYKNSSVTKEELLKEKYEKQIDIYARALEDITGRRVKERYLYLLKQGEVVKL